MQYLSVLQLVSLIIVANGSPVIARRILGNNFAWPLDGNIKFFDGRPLLGASKTVRGIVVAILMTSLCAPLLGLGYGIGLLVASAAMLGDLLSSFVKRRLGFPPSSQVLGIDQVPESLFPLLACRQILSLTVLDIASGTVLFFAGEVLLSRALYKLHVRDRPY